MQCDQLMVMVVLFHAADGIRDFHVTGVQTCALPISGAASPRRPGEHELCTPVTRLFRCAATRVTSRLICCHGSTKFVSGSAPAGGARSCPHAAHPETAYSSAFPNKAPTTAEAYAQRVPGAPGLCTPVTIVFGVRDTGVTDRRTCCHQTTKLDVYCTAAMRGRRWS